MASGAGSRCRRCARRRLGGLRPRRTGGSGPTRRPGADQHRARGRWHRAGSPACRAGPPPGDPRAASAGARPGRARGRGPPLLRPLRRGRRGGGPRRGGRRRHRQHAAGRQHPHPAAGEEHAGNARAQRAAQGARGGAGHGPGAFADQGPDPRALPEHRVLRPGHVWRGRGRAGLLRPRPGEYDRGGGCTAGGADPLPLGGRPGDASQRRPRPADRGAAGHDGDRRADRRASARGRRRGAADPAAQRR